MRVMFDDMVVHDDAAFMLAVWWRVDWVVYTLCVVADRAEMVIRRYASCARCRWCRQLPRATLMSLPRKYALAQPADEEALSDEARYARVAARYWWLFGRHVDKDDKMIMRYVDAARDAMKQGAATIALLLRAVRWAQCWCYCRLMPPPLMATMMRFASRHRLFISRWYADKMLFDAAITRHDTPLYAVRYHLPSAADWLFSLRAMPRCRFTLRRLLIGADATIMLQRAQKLPADSW